MIGTRASGPDCLLGLGKRRPRVDSRTFKLARYLAAGVPSPPSHRFWATAPMLSWPMMLNDQLGDCVIAASGHLIQEWSTLAAPPGTVVTDSQVLKAYEDVGGYVPGDSSTDNGCVMLDALNYWRQTGIGQHQILAYVQVGQATGIAGSPFQRQFEQAIYLFGAAYIGLALPLTAQGQSTWSVVSTSGDGAPGSWGGHCVPVLGYSPTGLLCVTWGGLQGMTWNFLRTYCDEAYAVLSSDWIRNAGTGAGFAVSGFNLAALESDLAKL